MAAETERNLGLIAAAVSIRELGNGAVQSLLFRTVRGAIEAVIAALAENKDRVGVVVVGEDRSPIETELVLTARAAALTGAVTQAGLFVSLAAQDIVRDRLLDDVRFEDYGIMDVEGAGRTERLFAVFHPDLPEPIMPHKRVAGNCRPPNKSFVGRRRERDELQDLVFNRSIVTVIGFPGVGKSMTAIHVARSVSEEHEDGVWWFSVDDRASLDELLGAIGSAQGLLNLKGQVTVDRLAESLAGKKCVIILDGCEGMAEGIGRLCSAILRQSRGITILVTSTRPLGIEEEYVYRLEPMSLPRPTDAVEEVLLTSDAVNLFYERATQAGGRIPVDEQHVELAIQVCQRVDALPIAIELVAATLRTSSLAKVAEELMSDDDPTSGRTGISSRLQALERALDLSYGALSLRSRDLLHRLAMFRGEWKAELAEQLWADSFAEGEISELHRILLDSSWIAYDDVRNTYRMLNTVRSYCERRAGSSERIGLPPEQTYGFAVARVAETKSSYGGAELDPILIRFCKKMCALAETVSRGLQEADAPDAEVLLKRHYSDFIFALEASIAARDMDGNASALMKSLVFIWLATNLFHDADRLSSAYLQLGPTGVGEARALVMLGVVRLRWQKLDKAAEFLKRGLAISRELGIRMGEASALANLGLAMVTAGHYSEARRYYAEALPIMGECGLSTQLCQTLCNMAQVEVREWVERMGGDGQLERAQQFIDEASGLLKSSGPIAAQAFWGGLGNLAFAKGDYDDAEANFCRAIGVCDAHGLRHEAGESLEDLADLNLMRGQGQTAAKLLGLASVVRRERGKSESDWETFRVGGLMKRMHLQLDFDRAGKLMSYGARLELSEVLNPTVYNL